MNDTVRGVVNQFKGKVDVSFRIVGLLPRQSQDMNLLNGKDDDNFKYARVRFKGRRMIPPGDVWESDLFIVELENDPSQYIDYNVV